MWSTENDRYCSTGGCFRPDRTSQSLLQRLRYRTGHTGGNIGVRGRYADPEISAGLPDLRIGGKHPDGDGQALLRKLPGKAAGRSAVTLFKIPPRQAVHRPATGAFIIRRIGRHESPRRFGQHVIQPIIFYDFPLFCHILHYITEPRKGKASPFCLEIGLTAAVRPGTIETI